MLLLIRFRWSVFNSFLAMRSVFFSLIFYLSFSAFTQNTANIYLKTGFNRIGFLYEIGGGYNFARHNIKLGIRFYEPDFVFEKEVPGLHFSYAYLFRMDKKMKISLGINSGFFWEKKQTTKLFLLDSKFQIGTKWKLTQKLDLNLTNAYGGVINSVKTTNLTTKKQYIYWNYELALGLIYHFGNKSAD